MKHVLQILAVLSMLTLTSCAQKGSSQDSSQSGSAAATGPSMYHTVYGSIEDTIVKIQNFRLRTSDGQVINVPSVAQEVDLQDLQGLTKGLKINLAGITFPGNAATADIVEIEVDVVGSNARAISSDNSSCKLGTPKLLNFYTVAPVTVIAGETYLVKVNFTPLNSIQIDIVTKNKCKCDGNHTRTGHQHTAKNSSGPGSHDDDSSDDNCDVETTIQKCELVNRRQAVTQIIRPIDEF